MPDRSERRRVPPPLDPPMLPFVLAGTGIWALAGLVLLAAGAPSGWLWTCLAGVLVGLVVLPPMAGHDRRRRQRRSPAGAQETSSTSESS